MFFHMERADEKQGAGYQEKTGNGCVGGQHEQIVYEAVGIQLDVVKEDDHDDGDAFQNIQGKVTAVRYF